jgi:hypothetical protein
MRCRAELKPILIAKRMRKYWFTLRCGAAYTKFQRAAALRNLLRLVARYEEISGKLGITVAGIYSL